MKATKLAVIAVASALLLAGVAVGGAAAVPADLPEQADDHATANASADGAPNDAPIDRANATDPADIDVGNASDAPAVNGSNVSDGEPAANRTSSPGAASEHTPGDDRPGSVGPPDGLPEQVPEHVTGIHETIESFLDGTVENLGAQMSELLGDGDDETDADDEDE